MVHTSEILYRAVITTHEFVINARKRIATLSGPPSHSEKMARIYGQTLVDAKLAVGFRICISHDKGVTWENHEEVVKVPEEFQQHRSIIV